MKSLLYTLATVLLIVGALFILQGDVYGMTILSLGLVLNIIYRAVNLDKNKLLLFRWKELLKLGNMVFMVVACLSFVLDLEQKFNFLILSIIFDVLVNTKEITFRKKS